MPNPIVIGDLSGLGEGIQSFGSALGGALQQRFANQAQKAQQSQYSSILGQTLGKLPANASPIQLTQAINSAIQQGLPLDMASQYGTLYSTLNRQAKTGFVGPEDIKQTSQLFKKFGMSEDEADRNAELYHTLTTGGQTELAKYLVDMIVRKQANGDEVGFTDVNNVTEFAESSGVVPPRANVSMIEEEKYQFPNIKSEVFGDRTPKERAKFKGDLLKENASRYESAVEGVKAAEDEYFRFQQMDELNKTNKLPEGVQAFLNVNWATGEIPYPRLSTPEAQAYVKLVNDFTTKAKDSYGARVTNFELARFLKRLPTLANSREGRELILEQLKHATEINRLESDALKSVYDHYGTQNVTPDIAQREARKLIEKDVEGIRKKAVENLSQQESLEARKKTKPGYIPVKKPDGSVGQIPQDKIEEAQKRGWKIL